MDYVNTFIDERYFCDSVPLLLGALYLSFRQKIPLILCAESKCHFVLYEWVDGNLLAMDCPASSYNMPYEVLNRAGVYLL